MPALLNYSEEYEYQYFPNKWSNRYKPEEALQKHIEFAVQGSTEAKQTVPCELDVPYGYSPEEKLDIFGTDLPDDSPIFVYLHGGFWQKMHRNISSYMVKPLVKLGFKVVIIGYTLCPNITLSKMVGQIETAIEKCFEYAQIHNSRGVYLCGHSAGAHLIISLLQRFIDVLTANQELLKKIFLISGLFDLRPVVQTSANKALKLDDATAKQLSPLFQRLSVIKNVQVYVLVAEYDSPAFKKQSAVFHKKLCSLGFATNFLVVKGVDHFSIVEELSNEDYELLCLLNENM